MKTIHFLLAACLSLASCNSTNPTAQKATKAASTVAQDASAFANSPAGQAMISALVGASVNSVIDIGSQYATTGSIDPRQIVGAALDGSASSLRSITTSNTTAVTNAVNSGSGVPTVSAVAAPIAVQAVQAQVATGTSPAVAVQNAANVLNGVASAVRTAPVTVQPVPAATPATQ